MHITVIRGLPGVCSGGTQLTLSQEGWSKLKLGLVPLVATVLLT
uniref:Uncharacterized protein n=1 Tax=Anguilla anguilla TaxID=7936 RepID=A0A0E9SDV4_ANGAN